jgi:hypothetical protein
VAGLVSAVPDLDIAILKLSKEVGTPVTLGDASNMKRSDPIMMISSKSGLNLSTNLGIFVSYDSKNSTNIQSAIPVYEGDNGSPLFNTNGEVIGINTLLSSNATISISKPSTYLRDVQNKLKNTSFDNISYLSFDTIKEQFFYNKASEKSNSLDAKVWNEYKKVGNIEKNIVLPIIKTNKYDGAISIRYIDKAVNYIPTMVFTNSFVMELKKQNFKEKVNSDSKKVYTNNSYEVVITTKFNYLIVLINKK